MRPSENIAGFEAALASLHVDRVALNFSWLLKLRWAAVIGQLTTILTVAYVFGVDLPVTTLLAITGVGAVTNIAFVAWYHLTSRHEGWESLSQHGEALIGLLMVLDMVLLTGLLYVSGGPTNPFGIFYIVNVVLASALLRPLWGWVLGIAACVCYAVLFVGYMPLPALEPTAAATPEAAQRAWALHLEGTFVAFATATFITLYFFARLTREFSRLEQELVLARQRRDQGQRLAAMATLAAGAAHELSSPLSTIAVVAKELEHLIDRSHDLEHAAEDARLIRSEVDRCRRILDQMSADAGESAGEPLCKLTVRELIDEIVDNMAETERVHVDVADGVSGAGLFLPKRALAQALRGLVKNALDASPPGQAVDLAAAVQNGQLLVTIRDEGTGMDADTLEQAGHPFFTTKQPGQGMGLGILLARSVVERLGGRLDLASTAGLGTTAEVVLPREATADS